MAQGIVYLIFGGLIAFVPGDQAGTLTAFLVKSDYHLSTLTVKTAQIITSCPGSCTDYSGYCTCSLAGTFTLDPAPAPATKALESRPPAALPNSSTSLSDGWLVHMKNVDGPFAKIDKILAAKNVAAQGSFGWEEASTCAFDEEEVSGDRQVYALKFITRGNVVHEQAIAEAMVFKSGVASAKVTIKIPALSLELAVNCDGDGCPIWIQNAPDDLGDCDKCSHCSHGSHFEEYLKLTGGGPGSRRLFRQCGKSSQLATYSSGLCTFVLNNVDLFGADEARHHDGSKGYYAVSNRVICPMVVLEP